MDFIEIPGVRELQAITRGDPGIRIAVLDSLADLSHPSLRGAQIDVVYPPGLEPAEAEIDFALHATGIASIIFGQPGSDVEGLAPACRGINVAAGLGLDTFTNPLVLTRALDCAFESGAQIVHVAHCLPTESGAPYELVSRAIARCVADGRLVVAPAGNDRGECWCAPALDPDVLVAGAHTDAGVPFRFSNYGDAYAGRGVLAPGENILCAVPGGGAKRHKGTSAAAGVVSGLAALLLSAQKALGDAPDPWQVRRALLDSVIPCGDADPEECRRWLNGKLNLPGAIRLLFGERVPVMAHAPVPLADAASVVASVACTVPQVLPRERRIYAIGRIDYDFGSEAQLDAMRERMQAYGDRRWDPHEARDMAEYLSERPPEAKELIWTFRQEATPLYAIDPRGPFGANVYEMLVALLGAQAASPATPEPIDRVSLPGMITGRTATLRTGEVLPVVALASLRALYGWHTAAVVEAAVDASAHERPAIERATVVRELTAVLHFIYFDLGNSGATSPDRALNFAGSNAFQAAACCIEAVALGMTLHAVDVEKSRFCRWGSDCWDVLLTFYDPERGGRARRVFRFTIDVSDATPVTVGGIRSWAVPPRSRNGRAMAP